MPVLAFVLTLEDPDRFEQSRAVGAYVGFVAGKGQAGENVILKGAPPERAMR